MTNQEILEKAIQRAIDSGWKPLASIESANLEIVTWNGQMMEVVWTRDDYTEPLTWVRELEGIIFNHDFAKALWGIEGVNKQGIFIEEDALNPSLPADYMCKYTYHLQQMVIADDPIDYLGKHLG